MTPEELMIGDWYIWEAEGKQYKFQVNTATFSLAREDIANFQPVPLTNEILEKNGFRLVQSDPTYVSQGGVWLSSWVHKCGLELGSEHSDGTGICFNVVDMNIPVKYVHQLQHILRICNVQETIKC